jgi:metallo-beta-lactamase family protein
MRTVQQSRSINEYKKDVVIISAPGMVTGGRVVHHCRVRLPDARHTILFCGFQALGTRGRSILEGAKSIRIHGLDVAVKAHVEQVMGFSGHADRGELLRWIGLMPKKPQKIFLVHGEPNSLESFSASLSSKGYDNQIAAYEMRVDI